MRAGTRQFRRINGVLRSHVFNTLQSTITGLSTIRAFDGFDRFESQFCKATENETNSFAHTWILGNYIGLRLNFTVSVFSFLVALIAVATRSGNAALGSLAISYSIRLAAAFQWSVRNGIDAESYLTSVERLVECNEKSDDLSNHF